MIKLHYSLSLGKTDHRHPRPSVLPSWGHLLWPTSVGPGRAVSHQGVLTLKRNTQEWLNQRKEGLGSNNCPWLWGHSTSSSFHQEIMRYKGNGGEGEDNLRQLWAGKMTQWLGSLALGEGWHSVARTQMTIPTTQCSLLNSKGTRHTDVHESKHSSI